MNENNRVRIPCNIVSGVPIHFPIDNCDFKDDTLDGKKELHDTAQVAIQKSASNTLFLIKIDRRATKFKDDFLSAKPIPRNESFSAFSGKVTCNKQESYNKLNRAWALCQVIVQDFNGVQSTWPAFNSLISPKPNLSPNLTLYAALKVVQGINIEVTRDWKVTVSFDLQLYSKYTEFRSCNKIHEEFAVRLGELHTVFLILKVIGKYIEESGKYLLILKSIEKIT